MSPRLPATLAATAAQAAAALAATALATAAPAPPGPATPARTDVFHGRISAASGRYAALRGAVTVSGSFGHARIGRPGTLRLTLRGALAGTLGGTASQHMSIPDVGAQLALSGRGRVSHLGDVRISGTASGTGFIARGRLRLALTLRGRAGSVTISAQSGLVPGFTAP